MLDLPLHISEKVRKAEILLIGCSAGGFNLVFDLLLAVPQNYPIPIIVIMHRGRKYKSSIEELIGQKANVQVLTAMDKAPVEKNNVYFAPADYHLLIEPEKVFALDYSEPIHFCRPAIDVTFQSAADVYGDKTIGIILSGANYDGADGLSDIEKKGGLVIVQDPAVAEVKTMPTAAIKKCANSVILTNEELFEFIKRLPLLKPV